PRVTGVGPLVLLVHAHVDGDGEVALAAPGARRAQLGVVTAGHDRFETSLSWIDPDHLNAAVDREVLGAGWLDGRVLDPGLERRPLNQGPRARPGVEGHEGRGRCQRWEDAADAHRVESSACARAKKNRRPARGETPAVSSPGGPGRRLS